MRRKGAVVPRKKPSGQRIPFPECAEWTCDDDEDWSTIGPDEPDYPSVKREYQIARYHEPRSEWRSRLQDERDRLNEGRPLWMEF